MQTTTVNKFRFISTLITFSIVLIFGIVFLSLFLHFNGKIPENYVETQATIVRITEELSPTYDPSQSPQAGDYEHQVFVNYTYNGKNYEEKEYGNYSSSMKKGDSVLLYLNPDNPEDFIPDPSGNTVFVIIGIVIIFASVGGIGYSIYKKKKGE